MDMYTLKWTRLQNEIIRLLCIKAGLNLSLREISRLLKVSPSAISKAIINLEKEEFIIIKRDKRINLLLIGLNRDKPFVVNFKRAENLKLLYESGLSDFLRDEFMGSTIFLFGSYSYGEDVLKENNDGNSDIDIAVIGRKEKQIDLSKFEKLLEREIIINFYDSWEDIHKNLKDNILNGILLNGGVDL